MAAAKAGEEIPEGWALDAEGRPTRSPEAALGGTMVPMGEAKGAALAMMVEVLSATLVGANHGFEASSFFEAEGPAPAVGQLLIAIDPVPLSGGGFTDRLEVLIEALEDQPRHASAGYPAADRSRCGSARGPLRAGRNTFGNQGSTALTGRRCLAFDAAAWQSGSRHLGFAIV